MGEFNTAPPDALPPGAELALTAEHVVRVKGTVVVGRVECDELHLGDVVVAVGAAPICQGRVAGWEQFNRPAPAAVRRGEQIALMFDHWGRYELPPDVRLYRIRRHKRAEPQRASDRGGSES